MTSSYHPVVDNFAVVAVCWTVLVFGAGAHPAAQYFWHAIPAWLAGLLVPAHDRRCASTDAGDGDVDRDSHGGGGNPVRVFGFGGLAVLSPCAAQRGSGRNRAPGDRRMSTVRSVDLTLASRANAYIALTKPDVSFLVLMTTAAGYYMGARGPEIGRASCRERW